MHGTTNDLAVAGAVPKYLSLGVLLEEGLEFAVLERVVAGIAAAAKEIGVVVAAGDTKVVRRGEGGGIYLNTSGIGVRNPNLRLGMREIRAGDAILVSGPVGDHGIAVMLAREQFGLRGDLQSDAASVLPITLELARCKGLRFMRDPTRGGLATVMHEIVQATGLGVHLDETQVPVRDSVRSVCEMLGYDPYFLACEGRVVAVVAGDEADAALAAVRALPSGARCRDHRPHPRAAAAPHPAHAARRRTRDRGTRGRSAAADLLTLRSPAMAAEPTTQPGANSGPLSM